MTTMTGPFGFVALDRAGADEALAQAETAVASASASLVALEAHPGYGLLLPGGFTGLSARRREETMETVAGLHRDLALYRDAAARARTARGGSRRPSTDELAEVGALLFGESVVLSEGEIPLQRRGLLGPTHLAERTTPAALLAGMTAAFDAATAVVAAVATVWDAVVAALAPLDTEVVALERDGSADAPEWRARLDETRRRVLVDPLAHPGANPIAPADLARLREGIAEARRRAAELGLLRDGLDARLAAATGAVDAVAALEQEVVRVADEVRRAVTVPALPTPARRAPGLRALVRSAGEAAGAGRWEAAAETFARLDAAVADARRAAGADRALLTGLLDRRAELRGRLGALQAKARARGRAEDLGLDTLTRTATDLLWTAPCDLAAATVAVRRVQRALDDPDGGRP